MQEEEKRGEEGAKEIEKKGERDEYTKAKSGSIGSCVKIKRGRRMKDAKKSCGSEERECSVGDSK